MKELFEEREFQQLKEEFKNMQVADIAEFLDDLQPQGALIAFRLLSKETAADVFSFLSNDRQTELAVMVSEKELNDLINELYFDDKIDLLEELPANMVKRILQKASDSERKLINQFLNYPENSAGSLMTIEFVDLKKEMEVGEALERVRRIAPDKETIYTCYVTDGFKHLEGIVSLKDLVLSSVEKKLEDIMQKDFVFVNTQDDQEDIADVFKKYDLLSVPVVDNEKRLVGIITIDDIVDVIEQENTEDFHRMAALQPSDEEYLNTGVLTLTKRRITWLLILMISATFTGYIIRRFEATLESVVALAVFIPMLMDTGGNAGSQASTLIIRSMALGEVTYKDILKVMWKEMRVSLLVGTGLSIVNFLRIFYIERYELLIALIVSMTLIVTVMLAKILGGALPIVAKMLKLDPAIMASPLITTIVDTISLFVYFTFATWLLAV